jgi:hypothetical protein
MNTKIKSWIERYYLQIVAGLGVAAVVSIVMFWHQIAFLQAMLTVIAGVFGGVYYFQRQ